MIERLVNFLINGRSPLDIWRERQDRKWQEDQDRIWEEIRAEHAYRRAHYGLN